MLSAHGSFARNHAITRRSQITSFVINAMPISKNNQPKGIGKGTNTAPSNSERPSSSHPGISLDPSLLIWRTYATRLQVRMHKWVKANHGLIDPNDTYPYMLAHLDEWIVLPGAHKWVGEAIGLYASATKWAGD